MIPNRNAAAILQTCLTGLLERTSYSRREVVIVDNGSTDPEVFALYDRLRDEGKGRVVPFDRPFNFSAACNLGAAAADGELLLFLNNDVEVVDPDWLDELVRWAQLPQIGIVGAKLLYPIARSSTQGSSSESGWSATYSMVRQKVAPASSDRAGDVQELSRGDGCVSDDAKGRVPAARRL